MKHSQGRGFTLIEMMVVIAIIGILATIAYPSYRDYIIRGRIPEGLALLSNEKIVMEKFLADNRVYNGTLPGGTTVNACNRYLPSPQISTRYFDVTGCVATATTYTLTVSGKDDATERSMAGFSYTINEMGGKATIIETNHAGWPTMNKPCWVLKKDGTC